jgi:hypothetical protein
MPQGQQGQQGQGPGEQMSPDGENDGSGGQAGEGERGLAERQEELGDRVEELARRFGQGAPDGETGEGAGPGLDERALRAIERAQRRAGQALRDGNEFRALGNQEQATQQLRDLAEGLADELDALRAERLGENAETQEGGTGSPFGLSNNGGVDDSNSVDIPDEIERQRARDILDLLRQRYDEATDEEEREYLERLLDRF